MATAEVDAKPATPSASELPDYLTDPDATSRDDAQWRYGKAPDYSNTRRVWEQSMSFAVYHNPVSMRLYPYTSIFILTDPTPPSSKLFQTVPKLSQALLTHLTPSPSPNPLSSKLTPPLPSKIPHPRPPLPPLPNPKPRQKLGSRSLLQAPPLRLAHHRLPPLFLLHQRPPSAIRRTHATRRHLLRRHLRQRILRSGTQRFCKLAQELQADDEDVCLGGAGGLFGAAGLRF